MSGCDRMNISIDLACTEGAVALVYRKAWDAWFEERLTRVANSRGSRHDRPRTRAVFHDYNLTFQLIGYMPITIRLADPPLQFHRAKAVTHLLAFKDAPFNERVFSKTFTNIVITETLSARRRSTVYGGHLCDKEGGAWLEDGKQADIVVKMGSMKAITTEARRYHEMRHLQGSVLPRMYGLLKAAEGDRKRRMGLLVLERFGTSLRVPLKILERPEMYATGFLLRRSLIS
jgi:hypothetical protein